MNSFIKIVIPCILVFLNLVSFSQSISYHTSRQTGEWGINSTWENDSRPNSNNHMVVTIKAPHTVTITGNLSLNNNITINVEDGANFIVNGNLSVGNNTTHPFTFTLNGTATVTGNLTGVGSVSGDGELKVGGTIGSSINYVDFEGDIYINDELVWSDGPISGLPIELLDFTAKVFSQCVSLTWLTAAEINNDFFTIERSRNGVNWEILTFVQGAGNSNQVLTYTWEDDQPLNGISYYRLKQTDFDGQFEYFVPVAVNFSSSVSKAEIVQVAAFGQQMDILLSNPAEAAYLIISDIQGRIIHRQMIDGSDSVQQITVNLPDNYSGNVMVIRLTGQQKSDERKIRVS
jgi:hypothetical protein